MGSTQQKNKKKKPPAAQSSLPETKKASSTLATPHNINTTTTTTNNNNNNNDAALPRHVKRTASALQPLVSSTMSAAHIVASKQAGSRVARQSLAGLYALAYALRRTQGKGRGPLPYHVPRLETSEAKHTTAEQIWGQMNVLLRPVLRRLQDRVREAQKTFGASTSTKTPLGSEKKTTKKKKATTEEDEAEEVLSSSGEEDESEEEASAMKKQKKLKWDDDEDDDEDALDAEIAQLLESHTSKKLSKHGRGKEKGTEGEEEAWRYAFGKGAGDDEEDEEDANEEDENEEGGGGDRRVSDRNRRVLEEMGDDDDDDDEKAALKELYGDDYEDDGEGFLEDDEADKYEEEGEEEDEDRPLYNDRDGQFFGYDNILDNDEDGLFGGDDPTTAADSSSAGGAAGMDELDEALERDEELQAFLRQPDVSELEKERLIEKKKVQLMEERRLYGVNQWAMAGESSVTKRPRDALLELDQLDFEYGMKPVPVVTEASTAQLEDRIKKRIIDKNFDDVTRRVTALSSPDDVASMEAKRAANHLDGEKSKLSLMDLYEKEYMEKQRLAEEAAGGADAAHTAEPLTEIERDELRAIQMWKRLSQHLDALSNFYFTPKPVKQDLEARVRAVEGQAPALRMEAVGQFATTREAALAPQDLYRPGQHAAGPHGEVLVGSAEMTPQERRAQRRRLKAEGAVKKRIIESKREASKKEKAAATAATTQQKAK